MVYAKVAQTAEVEGRNDTPRKQHNSSAELLVAGREAQIPSTRRGSPVGAQTEVEKETWRFGTKLKHILQRNLKYLHPGR
jgi:hypothetical protein